MFWLTKIKNSRNGSWFMILILLVFLNLFARSFHTRWDLTSEKRFSLSPSTIRLLRNLKGTIHIKVYLAGKMPAGFKHLEQSTRDLLEEFQEYSGPHIQFKFIDPSAGTNDNSKSGIFDTLIAKGIKPYNLTVQLSGSEGYSEHLIFPGAILKSERKESAIDLLEGKKETDPLETLNNADALLEYKFADAIYHLNLKTPPLIGYMLGNGELLGPEVNDALESMSQRYLLDTINLLDVPYIPSQFRAVVFEKPAIRFSESEKIRIDQYLMNGGKIIWFVDDLNAEMDSLVNKNDFIAFEKGLNLNDFFFNDGIRINPDLVEDLQCDEIPLVVGNIGKQPQIQLVPWPYFPLLTPTENHPIVRNLSPVLGQFVNSIDTLRGNNIHKTILLSTSKFSRIVPTPAKVSWESVKFRPREQDYNRLSIPTSVLLEGKFHSLFENRLDNSTIDSLNEVFPRKLKWLSNPTAMIVTSDGDIITNPVSQKEGPLPMGTNEYTRAHYANKEFFLNCLEYLTNSSGILESRNKTYKLRLMDPSLIRKNTSFWELINFGIPAILALITGLTFTYFRRKKYSF